MHLCREGEFGSNIVVYTWRTTKLHLHSWVVGIVSSHQVQSERRAACLCGGEVILAVVDMSSNGYSVGQGTYAILQKTLHNITATWSRQQWNSFYETIAFEEENEDLYGFVFSQTFHSHSPSLCLSLLPAWAAEVESEKIRDSVYSTVWMMGIECRFSLVFK